jgi:hexosaminidase
VVPAPAKVTPAGHPYKITSGTRIRVDDSRESRRIGEYLAGILRPSTGYRLPVTSQGKGGIQLRLAKGTFGAEGYRLVSGTAGVTITASKARRPLPRRPDPAPTPARRRREELRAARPLADRGRHHRGLPALRLPRRDARRLPALLHGRPSQALHRRVGALQDQHLHLHLSDDQGWRIAINSWPRLATYGGSTEVGGGAGGYYTKADYKEIVRYASSRYLEVVPEIDMPGHTNAALASYADLNCDGVAPPLYTGTDVGFSSLCVGKDLTYSFVDDVIRELAAITPGRYSTSAATRRTPPAMRTTSSSWTGCSRSSPSTARR